jgi:hypothetical protein
MILLKKVEKYYSKHPQINAGVHVVVGLGFGVLLTHPMADPHPVRWGLALIGIGLLGHLWAGTQK